VEREENLKRLVAALVAEFGARKVYGVAEQLWLKSTTDE
jgi:hypothetical protein